MAVLRGLALLSMLCCALPVQAADIADYFGYYMQTVQLSAKRSVLDFLQDDGENALKASPSREVTIDRANGYLQISDSAGTDQVLTMAVYRKADGSPFVVVGASNCADGCTFSVQFCDVVGDHLSSVPRDSVIPAIEPVRFIKPGMAGPTNEPKVNYVPARVGTTLTLKPWYGYEVEEQMKKPTRAAIQDVVLTWDPTSGRFR
jgi:hypothetical protein